MMLSSDFDPLELIRRHEEEVRSVKCRRRKYFLVDFIADAIENDEVQPIIVYGRRGGGKSTYALKTVVQYLMQHQGLECGDAFIEALKMLVHTPQEVFDAISQRQRIMIWDDAGVWLSTYFWYIPEMRPYLTWFLNWFDTSRTDVNVIIFTVPHLRKLPPRVREDPETLRVRVRRVGTKYIEGRKFKVADAHLVRLEESEYTLKQYTEDLGYDEYIVYLPDPVYRVYKQIRDHYHILASQMLQKVLPEDYIYVLKNLEPNSHPG